MSQQTMEHAFCHLLAVHEDVPGRFGNLDDAVLQAFLGEFDTPQLRRQVRAYGDGYTLRSLPRNVDDLRTVDVFVLVVMNSPKLNVDSVFDPFTQLPDIHYWREQKALETQLDWGEGPRGVQFMVWEQECPVHGATDYHARRNQQLLVQHVPELDCVFRREAQAARDFLLACVEWLHTRRPPLIILTNAPRCVFCEPIAGLLGDRHVVHIPTKIFGPNRRIMDRIVGVLGGSRGDRPETNPPASSTVPDIRLSPGGDAGLRTVLEKLYAAFPKLYDKKKSDHTFSFRRGATIYVRKSNDQYARFISRCLGNFPNGDRLSTYVRSESISRDASASHPDYLIGPEHIDKVISILKGLTNA